MAGYPCDFKLMKMLIIKQTMPGCPSGQESQEKSGILEKLAKSQEKWPIFHLSGKSQEKSWVNLLLKLFFMLFLKTNSPAARSVVRCVCIPAFSNVYVQVCPSSTFIWTYFKSS